QGPGPPSAVKLNERKISASFCVICQWRIDGLVRARYFGPSRQEPEMTKPTKNTSRSAPRAAASTETPDNALSPQPHVPNRQGRGRPASPPPSPSNDDDPQPPKTP